MRSTSLPPLASSTPTGWELGSSLQTGSVQLDDKPENRPRGANSHQGARSALGKRLGGQFESACKRVKLDSSPDPDPHHDLWKIIGIEQIDERKQITLFNLGMKLAFGGEAVVKAIIELIAVGEITRECLKPEETQVEALVRLIEDGIVTEAAVQKCIESGAEDLVYLKKLMSLENAITALIDNGQITPQDLEQGESHAAALASLLAEGTVTEAAVQRCITGPDPIDLEMLTLVASGGLGNVLAGLVEKGRISEDSIKKLTAGRMPTLLSIVLDLLKSSVRSDLSEFADLKYLKEKADAPKERKVTDKERIMPLVPLLEDPRHGLCHHKGKMLSSLDFAYVTRMDFVVDAFTKSPDEGIRKAAETMQRWIDIRENLHEVMFKWESEAEFPTFPSEDISHRVRNSWAKLWNELDRVDDKGQLALLKERAVGKGVDLDDQQERNLIQWMSHGGIITFHEQDRITRPTKRREVLKKALLNAHVFARACAEVSSGMDATPQKEYIENCITFLYGKILDNENLFEEKEWGNLLPQIVDKIKKDDYFFLFAKKECIRFVSMAISDKNRLAREKIIQELSLKNEQLRKEKTDGNLDYVDIENATSQILLMAKIAEWKKTGSMELLKQILEETKSTRESVEKSGRTYFALFEAAQKLVMTYFDLFLHAGDSEQKKYIVQMTEKLERRQDSPPIVGNGNYHLTWFLAAFSSAIMKSHHLFPKKEGEMRAGRFPQEELCAILVQLFDCINFASSPCMNESHKGFDFSPQQYKLLISCMKQGVTEFAELAAMECVHTADSDLIDLTTKVLASTVDQDSEEFADMGREQQRLVLELQEHRLKEWARTKTVSRSPVPRAPSRFMHRNINPAL